MARTCCKHFTSPAHIPARWHYDTNQMQAAKAHSRARRRKALADYPTLNCCAPNSEAIICLARTDVCSLHTEKSHGLLATTTTKKKRQTIKPTKTYFRCMFTKQKVKADRSPEYTPNILHQTAMIGSLSPMRRKWLHPPRATFREVCQEEEVTETAATRLSPPVNKDYPTAR